MSLTVVSRAIQDKLGLDEDGVEDLAVRAFQLKLLRGRLDQGIPALNRQLLIFSDRKRKTIDNLLHPARIRPC